MDTEVIQLKNLSDTEAASLVTSLVRTVEPETWQRLGGMGVIRLYTLINAAPGSTNRFLLVRQTVDVVTKINTVLTKLRVIKTDS